MIKLENEHYIRFILLLIKGGTEVLRKTFTKGLEKQNVSLNEFLQRNKVDICNSKQISKLQRDILYPPSPHFSDISKWDISLLSYIALNFLSNELSGTETTALKKIRDMRNDIQGHSNNAAIETRKFTSIWSKLSLMITTLSYTMPDEDRQGLIDLISTLSSDQLDIYKAIEELKLLERRDEFFECIQTSLENLQRSQTELASAVDSCHKDVIQMKETTCQGLLDIKKQLYDMSKNMENRGENTKIVNTMFGRVRVSADDQIIVDTAENVLLSASVESVRKSESSGTFSAVKEKVDTFVEDVEGLSVKVDSVGEGSIVFTFTCSSLGALIDLIDYFQSPLIQRRLDDIAIALESVICHKVRLTASIPVEPLQEIVKKLQAADPQRTLKFSMTCTGVEGLQHAWEVFEEEAASNSINNLSKALTDAVGKPVRVETAIDMEQMKKAIQLTKAQLDGSRDIDSGENLAERFEEVHVGDGGVGDTKKDIDERMKDSPGKCFEGEDSIVVKETGADQRQGGVSKRPKTEKKIVLERESKRQKIEEESETKPNDDERTRKVLEEGQQAMVFGLGKPDVMNEDKSNLNITSSSSVNLFSLDSEKRNDNIGEQTLHGGNSEDGTNVQRKKITKIEIEKMDVSTAENTQAQYGDYGHDVDAAFKMQTRSKTKKALADRETDSGNAKNVSAITSGPDTNTKDILFREAISNWRREADNEKEDARRNGFHDLRGTHTVICLDTSGSMEHGNAWKQAEKFYKDFLNGMIDLKKEGIDHENVALVTFSGEVLVQERLTKDFEKLLEKFDTLKPSGPTQMFGGLLFAEAVALTSKFSFAVVNNVHIRTKIIIITDSMPTEIVPVCTHDDINDSEKIEETKRQIIKEVERIQYEQVDIHCVYVGESDSCEKEFLRRISTASVNEGLLSATDGEKMARHTVYKCLAENSSFKGGLFKDLTPDFLTFMKERLSERDLSSLLDLPDLSKLEEMLMSSRDFYKECDDKRYPEIGKRVRRGRDWKWGNQDSSGVGTIIGHGMEEETQLWVWVEWDADGEQNLYRWQCGSSKKSDLMFVDEERILKQGEILAVGTKVRKAESEENAEAMTGIVIKITKDEEKALVRWEDKTRDEYFFGKEDTQKEIVVIVRKESGDIGNRPSGSQDSGYHAGASLPPEGPVEVTDVLKDSAVLIWKKPTHEGSTNLTSYQIEWRVNGKEWPVTIDRIDAGPATLSYRLTHLRGNTEYEADIKAVNDTGLSASLKCKIRTKHQLELSLPSVQHKVLTPRYLARIVDAIGFNWELLAAELEINLANIQQVRMNNCTYQVRILDILTTWQQREGPDATFGELIKRMRNVKSVPIDWPIIEEIANYIDKESKK